MKNLTVDEIKTIKLLADNGMSVTKTADKSYCARKSIYIRVRSISRKTGNNPLDFWGLKALVETLGYEKETDPDSRQVPPV